MSYAPHRSCRRDLLKGTTDGTYKAYAPNRGGVLEDTTARVRRLMSPTWHGFEEAPVKVLTNGTEDRVPYYADVAPLNKEYK